MSGLQVVPDPEREALEEEVRELTEALEAVILQRRVIEQRVREFTRRQDLELNALAAAILARDLQRAEEAFANDPSEAHRQAVEAARAKREAFEGSRDADPVAAEVYAVTEEEAEELKRRYRQAVRLCHPDLVAKGLEPIAREVCQRLIQAYRRNDLLTVTELLYELQTEGLSGVRPAEADESDLWRRRADVLRRRLEREQTELEELMAGAAYTTLERVGDWDSYFALAKSLLRAQLDEPGDGAEVDP